MGVGCSLQQPPSHPQFLRLFMLSVGSLAEDTKEQSSQLSLVQAAEIPAHFLWASLGLPEPREAAMGVAWRGVAWLQAASATQACEWDSPSDTHTINVQTQRHFGTVLCRPGSACSQGGLGSWVI